MRHECSQCFVRIEGDSFAAVVKQRAFVAQQFLLKKGEHRRESVDLNELVESTLRLLNSELVNRQVRIRADLTRSLPTIAADPIQVQQVLLNLMMNAIEAMSSTPASLCGS